MVAPETRSLIFAQLDRVANFAKQLQGTPATFSQSWARSNRVASFLRDREIALSPRQGVSFPVSFSLSGEYNEQGEWVLSWLFRDLRDRKQAEAKIREQAALIDIASDAILVWDLNYRIVFWNKGAEQLYGWRKEDAMGKEDAELLRTDPSQLEIALRILEETGTWQGEISQRTKADRKILVASCWTLVRDELGRFRSLLSVNTDITQQKQLEAQFYQAQRLESLGELASGIAHDLNNVFTPILALTKLISQERYDWDARCCERLQLIEDSAREGAQLVQQILTFARGSTGEPIAIDLVPLLQAQVEFLRQSFPQSIAIELETPEPGHPLPMVVADSTHLKQVFVNLCINARDAMPEGGTLILSATSRWVDEKTAAKIWDARAGNYVLVTVTDTGCGIPPEVRDRIFDPFFTTKDIGQGTGLGLAIVSGIVKNYRGFVQVSSEVGIGTEVNVFLPVTEVLPPKVSPRPSDRSQDSLNGEGEQILIVEDNAVVRGVLEAILDSYDYTTFSAKDGVEAIALYQQHRDAIGLVILDVMMPNMGGIPLIQNLKGMDPEVKTIALSGLPTNREPVLAAGASVFLAKPYLPEQLLKHVRDLLGDRASVS